MAILPRNGRAAIAKAIKEQPLYMAWGTGLPEWDGLPVEDYPEDVNATGLINEIGRRVVTAKEFVTPDEAGTIEIAGAGKFSVTSEPTNLLLITTRFDFADAIDAVIRELGIFIYTEIAEGLPPGQVYFTPADIADPGMLLQLEHKPAIFRSAGTRETFEILIIF